MTEEKSPWAKSDAFVVAVALLMVALLTWWLTPGKAPTFSSPGVMATLIDNRVLIGVLRATGVIVVIYAIVSMAMLLKGKVLITKAGGVEANRIALVETVEQETVAVFDNKDETIASLAAELTELRERLGEPAKPAFETVGAAKQQTQVAVSDLRHNLFFLASGARTVEDAARKSSITVSRPHGAFERELYKHLKRGQKERRRRERESGD